MERVDDCLDRDGVRPVEGPYLLWGMDQGYQRWKDQAVIDEIIEKPLPDLEQLNEAIPKSWSSASAVFASILRVFARS
jgi:hypothetical protein